MSSEDEARLKGIVRRYYHLIDGQDIDGVIALFADDAVYARPGYAPFDGIRSITDFYRTDRIIVSGRHELSAVLADGPCVASEGVFAGTLRDGREVTARFAEFWRFGADDLVTRRDTYFFTAAV